MNYYKKPRYPKHEMIPCPKHPEFKADKCYYCNGESEMKPSERIGSTPCGSAHDLDVKREIDALHDRIEALEKQPFEPVNVTVRPCECEANQELKKLTREQYEALIETLRKELL